MVSTAYAGVPREGCDQSAMCQNEDLALPQHPWLHMQWTLNKHTLLRIITH